MSDFDEREDDTGVEIIDLDEHDPALSDKDGTSTPLLSPASWLHPRQAVSRRQLQVAGVGIVALLLLALLLNASGLLSSFIQARGKAASHGVTRVASLQVVVGTVDPTQADGLSCVMDAAWSPDSSHVVVLGYSADCAQDQNRYEPGLLNIYDAHTGKITQQVKPDGPVLTALRKQFPFGNKTPAIYYQNVRWSPNGQEIAVTFNEEYLQNLNAPSFSGIYLLNPNGRHAATVFLWKQTQDLDTSYLLWDLQAGQAREISAGTPLTSGVNPSIATAPAYQWGADGMLIPAQTESSHPGPVGNPDRDQTFTPWQSGYLGHETETDNKPAHLPGVYLWTTFLTAWSPDGRYLAMLVDIVARLTWPGQPQPSHQALVDLEVDKFGTLPVRDRALKAVMDSLPADPPGGYYGLEVAWRPDGRVLAAYDNGNVDLYDCTTGKKLASLIPNQGNVTNLAGAQGIVGWSPDGSHLLLSGATWGPVAIWGPGQLPHVP